MANFPTEDFVTACFNVLQKQYKSADEIGNVTKMYINPLFASKIKPHINSNFERSNVPVSKTMHINPRFLSGSELYNNAVESLSAPKTYPQLIHINPNVLKYNSTSNSYENVNITYKSNCDYDKGLNDYEIETQSKIANDIKINIAPLTTNSRYKLVRSQLPCSSVKNDQTNNNQSAIKSVSKFTYTNLSKSKVTQPIVQPVNSKSTHLSLNKYKLVSVAMIKPEIKQQSERKKNVKSHNKVWRRSGNSCIISSKYKLQRQSSSSTSRVDNVKSSRKTLSIKSTFRTKSVLIDGRKFALSNNSLKMLRPISAKTKINSPFKKYRICIEGKTYVRKSNTMFTREVHNRTLNNKLKKTNILCPVFRKFGICVRKVKGKCSLLHDKKHVNVCHKFLKGSCPLIDCKLSHDVSLEKMPTCSYFLKGCCTRTNCQYLHVKVNEKAGICQEFIKGYCSQGKNCNNKHLNICPDYHKLGMCNKVKCPYPHKKEIMLSAKLDPPIANIASIPKCTTQDNKCVSENAKIVIPSDNIARYFENKIDISVSNALKVDKQKLDILPGFISFEAN